MPNPAGFFAASCRVQACFVLHLQVLGQDIHMLWCSRETPRSGQLPEPVLHYESVFVGPRFLPNTEATTIAEAVEGTEAVLSLDRLRELLPHTRIVVVSLVTDLDGSNQRVKRWAAHRVRDMNKASLEIGDGVIIIIEGPCMAHILNTIGKFAFDKHRPFVEV